MSESFEAFSGQRVLLRVDLNIPMREGRVADASRIESVLPTIRGLMACGARVILLSHLGRPEGQRLESCSLAHVVPVLAARLGAPVAFVSDCAGPAAEQAAARLRDGQVLMLENLRFYAEEEQNDPAFAAALARLGDVYLNDAFSVAHRAHASIAGLARLLPAWAGPALKAEIAALKTVLENPERPVGAIVGGAKVSTKLAVLGNLTPRMDWIAIGGAMANTFLHALGKPVGNSLCERDMADQARAIMAQTRCAFVLPTDVVTAPALRAGTQAATCLVEAVPADQMILDLGPGSIKALIHRVGQCRTLLWNGPLGAFETPPFDVATVQVAQAAAEQTARGGLTSVAGGGDTIAALSHAGVVDRLSYVSRAGGAFLEWLEGKDMPGVALLRGLP